MVDRSPKQALATTVALSGLEAHLVRVEADFARGLPCFNMVGLPEACVRESRTRVRAALRHLGIDLNEHAVTVSLAPADLRKRGSAFDLAIAAAILAALERVPKDVLRDVVLLGELSLSGEVCAVRGVLPSLLGAKRGGLKRAIIPAGNAPEGAVVDGLQAHPAATLTDIVQHLRGQGELPRATARSIDPSIADGRPDLCDVRGQTAARRALEVAAAGGHNLLMIGPPGAGKTMLAQRLPSILPPMTEAEALEVTAIHSVAGLLTATNGLLRERPFRAPHHTLSDAALLGGGSFVRPGEVSLAHHGCLFLDELLEFRRGVIEGLRQPLEDGTVTIARARHAATFPARPLLVAAVNPCPCGYYDYDGPRACRCTPEQVKRYRSRLSGPLLDRIDLHVSVPPVTIDQLQSRERAEPSESVRARVIAARAAQRARAEAKETSAACNAALTHRDLDRVALPCPRARRLLHGTTARLGISARGYTRIRRVARTVADLEGSDAVTVGHFSEAIAGRSLDHALPGVAHDG
jgi:magnesium chelatase family protein